MHGKERKEVYFKIDVTVPQNLVKKHHEIREERQSHRKVEKIER